MLLYNYNRVICLRTHLRRRYRFYSRPFRLFARFCLFSSRRVCILA